MNATAPTARLKTRYLDDIRPLLIGRFGYSSVMQAPRLEKITLNMGLSQAKQDAKVLRAASDQLAMIAGQRPSVRRARKSVAAFKLREGNPVGVAVTLRGERGYEFLDRLISIAIPRIRDFRGLSPRSFDGRGNYSLGVREQIIFPEVDYDSIDEVRGLDITITTTAASDVEAFALLSALGMPFAARGRPAGFDEEEEEEPAESLAAENGETSLGAELENAPADTQGRADDAGASERDDSEADDAERDDAEQESGEAQAPGTGAVEPVAAEEPAVQDGAGEDGAETPAAAVSAPELQDGENGAATAVDATGAERGGAEHNGGGATAADASGLDDSDEQNDAEETDS
jgi:large subunit ribosomal protein L5